MKPLNALLKNVRVTQFIGNADATIANIASDSRRVTADGLFICIKGTQTDGHQYIDKAVALGATAVICEELPTVLAEAITYILVENSAEALGITASNFFDNPSQKLKLVGVTGTNGKTTTCTILYKLFMGMGYKTGLLSTVENRIAERTVAATHTTPDPISLNALLAEMVEAGCDYAFMEVSSHAAEQRRIAGLDFDGAVFTNISHDHLDYHKTFSNYIKAKKLFFDGLKSKAFALTNLDDKRGMVLLQNTRAKKYTYSVLQMADFRTKILENTLLGLELETDGHQFHSRLIGEFNAYNLTAIYGVARLLGHEAVEVLTVLSNLTSAEGRFDYVFSPERGLIGIVDYAHTPDALEKVLTTIDGVKDGNGRVLTVVGCGGDRDTKKRPIMAKTAVEFSDEVIFTSDNPRSEDPHAILAEMQAGVPPYATQKVTIIENRGEAIAEACRRANRGDVILIAGKGHEKYQEIKGVKYHFDDKEALTKNLIV